VLQNLFPWAGDDNFTFYSELTQDLKKGYRVGRTTGPGYTD